MGIMVRVFWHLVFGAFGALYLIYSGAGPIGKWIARLMLWIERRGNGNRKRRGYWHA
jgi:hypothetical protein